MGLPWYPSLLRLRAALRDCGLCMNEVLGLENQQQDTESTPKSHGSYFTHLTCTLLCRLTPLRVELIYSADQSMGSAKSLVCLEFRVCREEPQEMRLAMERSSEDGWPWRPSLGVWTLFCRHWGLKQRNTFIFAYL